MRPPQWVVYLNTGRFGDWVVERAKLAARTPKVFSCHRAGDGGGYAERSYEGSEAEGRQDC